jgi:citrate synthase
MAGWLAQWEEMLEDKEQKIARPRQIYQGYELRKIENTKGDKRALTTK